MIKIDHSVCIGCGACTGVCPTSSLSLGPEGKAVCNNDTCVECGACVGTCPVGAISQ